MYRSWTHPVFIHYKKSIMFLKFLKKTIFEKPEVGSFSIEDEIFLFYLIDKFILVFNNLKLSHTSSFYTLSKNYAVSKELIIYPNVRKKSTKTAGFKVLFEE